MQCKVFWAKSRKDLEDQVNTWLEKHPVTPDSMRFNFANAIVDNTDSYFNEFTIVMFYVPMRAL